VTIDRVGCDSRARYPTGGSHEPADSTPRASVATDLQFAWSRRDGVSGRARLNLRRAQMARDDADDLFHDVLCMRKDKENEAEAGLQ